jgi:Ca2+:H+ antiporter
LALLIGAFRFQITRFNAEGTGTALATVATLATLTLVLLTFTTSRPGPEFSPQLAFAAVASLILDGAARGDPGRRHPHVVPGRATRQEGAVHLVLLAAFVFLAINP